MHDISVAKVLGYVMDESTSNAEDETSPTDGVVGRRMVEETRDANKKKQHQGATYREVITARGRGAS